MEETLHATERMLLPFLQWLRLAIELSGVVWIVVGFVTAFRQLVTAHLRHQTDSFNSIRLVFSRYLSLTLEFQLAADILSTAITPTWTDLGKLGVTAVIRTALNYFLSKEVQEERARRREEQAVASQAEAPIQPAAGEAGQARGVTV